MKALVAYPESFQGKTNRTSAILRLNGIVALVLQAVVPSMRFPGRRGKLLTDRARICTCALWRFAF
jgi:hypothetical protein